ncbi:MAG: hypothetical protein RIF32_06440 [Leptospirales bacterium]|jgi:hypothetical protein
MSRGEKTVLIAIILGACLAGSFWLTGRSLAKARVLEAMNGRLIFSSAAYVRPGGPPARVLIDGSPESALPDLNSARYFRSNPDGGTGAPSIPPESEAPRAWPWFPGRPFVQLQVGLTHSPDRPPRPNPLRAMRIWPGDQASGRSFQNSARPRILRLIFFRQQVVDLDREYRLPEEPIFWEERTIRLKDRPGPQRIDLSWLAEPPESPGFPREVQEIWLRLEILDAYPGRDPARADAIALSELAFEFRDGPVARPKSAADNKE